MCSPPPGVEQYPALDLVKSVVTSPGGQSLDLLDTPAGALQWLTAHRLTSAGDVLHEGDVARFRTLRTHIRFVIRPHRRGQSAGTAGTWQVRQVNLSPDHAAGPGTKICLSPLRTQPRLRKPVGLRGRPRCLFQRPQVCVPPVLVAVQCAHAPR
ncbi:ABATE domain-containing protein [Streptomyces sp. NPDC088354]|uniref:ABATE domain-containing protein n=1 Tax=unclassified Streptomyces TaxID=2593676 RepID=UPI0029BC4602|nr:ABATE domain-containing protein [Streptomyces sp. MI02-7b]MDX3078606.1 ABATE domain-containing protein [Streptomyces sp. MI02-7b]